jgi:MFS family permease
VLRLCAEFPRPPAAVDPRQAHPGQLHVTDGQLGLIGGLYFALFYCFISIPVGWLADKTNRSRRAALACAIWSAATMACGLAANYRSSWRRA